MESLYLLIPLSMLLLALAISLFFWAINSGQYDDIERDGDSLLFEKPLTPTRVAKSKKDLLAKSQKAPLMAEKQPENGSHK